MKRIALLTLILALGLITVQPVRADIINYTLQATFAAYSNAPSDPWGIGSGTGTAVLNFTLAPPPSSTSGTPNVNAIANYDALSATLTLLGTNVDATYAVLATSGIDNEFSSSPATGDAMRVETTFTTSSGGSYTFSAVWGLLDKNFWGDSEVPPLAKLVDTADIIFAAVDIANPTHEERYYYAFDEAITINSQVVPVPGSIWLLASGLLGLGAWRRFRKS
jgi:hypothetical protein